jgi:hypothetical protein
VGRRWLHLKEGVRLLVEDVVICGEDTRGRNGCIVGQEEKEMMG